MLKLAGRLVERHVAEADEKAQARHEWRRVHKCRDGHWNQQLEREEEEGEELAERVRERRASQLRSLLCGLRGVRQDLVGAREDRRWDGQPALPQPQ